MATNVHLIMNDGQSAGTVSLDQARYLAEQYGLDLVAISPRSEPPVVRLLDYNKFRYQQDKHARQAVKTKNPQLKEVRLSYRINEHDLATKAKRAKEFLDEGHFVRAFLTLRGRENVFADKAKQILEDFRDQIGGLTEKPVDQAGKKFQIIIKGKK